MNNRVFDPDNPEYRQLVEELKQCDLRWRVVDWPGVCIVCSSSVPDSSYMRGYVFDGMARASVGNGRRLAKIWYNTSFVRALRDAFDDFLFSAADLERYCA